MIIGIINMQTNNINCFIKLVKRFGFQYKIINNANDYSNNISKLIIPGIGNYSACMNYLKSNKLDEIILKHFLQNKKILGICIGMQLFTSIGHEGLETEGLNIIENSKTQILETDEILPHIGWNKLNFKQSNYLFNNINLNTDYYFVHSYNVITDNQDYVIATTTYGSNEFISVISHKSFTGLQFHPEKSGINGIKIIENFLKSN